MQRGVTSISSKSLTINISSVNTSKSILLAEVGSNSGSYVDYLIPVYSSLNSNSITVNAIRADVDDKLSWQVIEFY